LKWTADRSRPSASAGFDHHNFDLTKLPKAQKTSFEAVEQIAALLKLIGADRVFAGGGGEDIEPLTSDGVASLSPQTSGAHYFDWHHTEADTLDKVDPVAFRHNIALLAVTSYILADADLKLTGAK
jgi:acetoin utilization deacetylase AcuC-like enzyme